MLRSVYMCPGAGSSSDLAQRRGVYAYGCTFHPTKKGKIMVK
ncbi:MAG TPA: hypothetical protein VKT54_15590 [Steroidobacteraceae bacterium]|nr:hypothetical protein [Steroidobacteraceae bacterium]